jgi:hypothetical protein
MNYWTSRKETAESIMMMLLLWLFHLKEEYGSHQESTSETFIHEIYSIQEIAVSIFNSSYLQAVSEDSQMAHFYWVSLVFNRCPV